MAKKTSKKEPKKGSEEKVKMGNEDKHFQEKAGKSEQNTTKQKEKKQEKEADESKDIQDETFEKLKELQDKYIRLSAEFDNYRKRTLKEKAELLKTAGEETIIKILPVMDDFERAINSMEEAKDIEAVKHGINLIYIKFKEFLKQQGVSEINAKETEFNTDIHEAVTKIPAPDENLKGKVVKVIEKGYLLNDKVIRYSKVVVGE